MSGIDGHSTDAPLASLAAASSFEPDRGPGEGPAARVEPVRFTLDGSDVDAYAGETILQTAERLGVRIPHLCYTAGMREDGNCRACVVEIEGERVLAPSCCRRPQPGMKVQSRSERARFSQKLVLELLLADTPATPHSSVSELSEWEDELGVARARFAPREQPAPDFSHPGIEVRLDACIQCTRCVRACREVQVNDVIGYAGRGAAAKIVFDLDDPMGESTCVGCGECVQACPTGALLPALLPLSRGARSGRGNGAQQPTPPQAYKPDPPFSDPDGFRQATKPDPAARAAAPSSPATGSRSGNGARADAHPASGVKPAAGWTPAGKTVASLCPYCGVGCQTTYEVREKRIVRVTGRDGPSNHGRLCVKGRFGFDYVHHPQRLLVPLIRRDGVRKDPAVTLDPADPRAAFREASWDEALDLAASKLRALRDAHGGGALAGFGSAKGSNEEAYLFQKLVRTGFGTNNVDHCTRLCHASSVAALMEGLNSGAVSNQVADVKYADVIFIIGANPTVNHPVAATFMKNAIERGAKLILADPRRTELARLATHMLQFRPDTDVALLNAMMHTIIEEGLTDERFIAERTKGFDEVRRVVQAYSPEAMEHVCGVPAAEIRAAARLYALSPRSMLFWGMGISQHVHGTDNARCLIALALMTGQIGRRGTGLHPLRGQNNVQGASDMGLIPMVYPDYQSVEDDAVRRSFEELWGARGLDRRKGLTVVEIMNAAKQKQIRGMYIMGENPAMSDPDVNHARAALAALDCLVVQDLFLTETASFADVILPASAFPEKTGTFTNTDRRVQLGRQALDLPGDARQDLWIIQELARRIGLDWSYDGPAGVWSEIRHAVPSCAGITWERLEREHAVTYPCRKEGDPGDEVIFIDRFPTADGLARFVPAEFRHGDEPPDDEYPHVLITGRLLEHWHTGSMTRRAGVLDALEPVPTASLRSEELQRLGVEEGELLTLETRRGSVRFLARLDDGVPKGSVFVPFCFVEAAANVLTNPALDPVGKIPEFKFCAVRISAGGAPLDAPGYGIAAST
jgi:formate dehydrogenase major subunit